MKRPLFTAVLATLLSAAPAAVAQPESEDGIDRGTEAEGTYEVTIDMLIDASIRSAPELARSKSDRAVAIGRAGAARAGQQWVVKTDLKYDRYSVGGDVDNVQPQQVVDERKFDATLGISRNLPTGGNVGVQLGFNRTQTEIGIDPAIFDLPLTPQPGSQQVVIDEIYAFHQTTLSATFRQPLLRGFGPRVALADQARADLQMTEATLKTQLAAEELLLKVISGYWEMANAAYEVGVRQDALTVTKIHEKKTRDEMRAGMQPASAVKAVEYELAVREEALLRAQLEYEKRSLELRRVTGIGIDSREIVLKPADDFEIGADEWDVEEVLARSRKANRRFASLILQKKIADVDVAVAKNATLPQVDVSLTGGLLGRGDSTSDAFSRAAGADGFQVTAGLSVQFDVSSAARSGLDAARAQKARVEVDRVDAERTLETEVVQAVRQVKSAQIRAALADKGAVLAAQNVESERAQFSAGRSNNFNVMQRQGELIESRVRVGRAIADYHTAVAQLQSLSGTLLKAYDIDVRPVSPR